MKKFLPLLFSSLITLCAIPACSLTNSDPKPVFVVPTNYGKECLKNSTIKESKRETVWNNGTRYLADNAYDMTVYSNINHKAHIDGMAYNSSDIDVQLFSIGTNIFNSPEAETILYATTDENAINQTTSNNSNLITGVEYAYQTGPIRAELGAKQEIWLKTTVMEASNGFYVESKKYQSTYTHIYLTILDGIPPRELNDLTTEPFTISKKTIIDNNSSEENLKEALVNFLYQKLGEVYDFQEGDFDEKGVTPINIRFKNFNMNANKFTGLMDLYDNAGNFITDQQFTIKVVGHVDGDEGIIIRDDLPEFMYTYRKCTFEQLQADVKYFYNHYENENKNEYSVEIIGDSLKLYSDGISEIRDFVKNEKTQEIYGNIYYKGVILQSNVKIGRLLLTDNIAPENNGKQINSYIFEKEMKKYKFNNINDYIFKGIDIIESYVDIYDEIFEKDYIYNIWIHMYKDSKKILLGYNIYDTRSLNWSCNSLFESELYFYLDSTNELENSLVENDYYIELTKDKQFL